MDNLPERRIVLLGKTGVGKSAAGNTILGRKAFHSEFSLSSVTSECKMEVSIVLGKCVSVIDTPGFFDTEMSQEAVAVEIGKSIYLSQPGAHAFLFVLRLDRVTEQEEKVIKAMEAALGPGVKDHTIILFTHGEKLKQINMEHEIKKNPKLRNLMENYDGRYHVISNKKRNGVQVKELMGKIDRMLEKNNGNCFTCEMYEAAKRAANQSGFWEFFSRHKKILLIAAGVLCVVALGGVIVGLALNAGTTGAAAAGAGGAAAAGAGGVAVAAAGTGGVAVAAAGAGGAAAAGAGGAAAAGAGGVAVAAAGTGGVAVAAAGTGGVAVAAAGTGGVAVAAAGTGGVAVAAAGAGGVAAAGAGGAAAAGAGGVAAAGAGAVAGVGLAAVGVLKYVHIQAQKMKQN